MNFSKRFFTDSQNKSSDEINEGYQKADNERWNQIAWVLGIEVRRSNNPDDCEICEAGAGLYPKDYNWTRWHPGCKCLAVSIMASDEEIADAIAAEMNNQQYEYDGSVKEFPKKMKDFMDRTGFKHIGHEDYFDKK